MKHESVQGSSDGGQQLDRHGGQHQALPHAVAFAYTVSVVFDGINYTTDPELTNEPGGNPCVMRNMPSDGGNSA